ncbi:MAG: hypothetical protein JWL71_4098 [Acidobacteria bacterium]|nr:hypothetical protein [Acidobacteriota bacterium]
MVHVAHIRAPAMLRRWLARLRFVRAGAAAVADRPQPPPRLEDALASGGLEITGWHRALRARSRLYTGVSIESLDRSIPNRPARIAAVIAQAERVLSHEFNLLGSGPFVPIDPDRLGHDGYRPIDWYLDPVRRLRFPRGVPYKEWKLYEMRPANADVKYPWELARCQHWATLGQAFLLTRDERFAREIAGELDDFMEANPVGLGINWTCTMDVALRAVSWAIALELISDSSALEPEFWRRAYSALFDHGIFIRANLENTYEVTSNHFLSNVAGLWFLGAVFADVPQGAAWQAFARESLEQEIDVQVLPDGADFESSIPYHRLVAELFLGCQRLADHQQAPLSPHYQERVRAMIAYLAAVQRPDGLMPQVGDADDGRLHVLSGYGTTTPQDARHLFGPASAMFGEPAWAAIAGDVAAWEAAWWGLTPPAPVAAITASRLCRDAGVAVMRGDEASYLLVTNGIVGTKGFGNHKHNDQLSFEYHPRGTPLIVDPGSYVYTSDPDARNLFRGTGYHSTLMIDGIEQNDTRPEWIFRMFESARAEHLAFEDTAACAEYVGRHHGYERLDAPVTHERRLRLDKRSGTLNIVDRLEGSGTHTLRWHFHFAREVAASMSARGALTLRTATACWTLRYPDDLDASVQPAAYSPSYGVKWPCSSVELSMRTTLDGQRTWRFEIAS